jgi:hypothetical protein
MKWLVVLFGCLPLSSQWLHDAFQKKAEIDANAKLRHSRVTKTTSYATYKLNNFKKITFASNDYEITDTFSRVRYIDKKFVFYVREWYVTDYLPFPNKPADFPNGEVCETIYLFKSKNDGILLQRKEPYFAKGEIDSLKKSLLTKPFDTLYLNSITYNRVKGKKGKIVHLRFKRD